MKSNVMTISKPYAKILADGRPYFNAQIAEAKRRKPGFDTEALSFFLQTCVNDLVSAIDATAPEHTESVAMVAFDMAITLTAQGLAGPNARNQLVGRIWRQLLPLVASQVAETPVQVLGSLTNAALYLEENIGLDSEQWLILMQALAGQTESASQLLDLGKVLVWRAGAAHFREGALAAARLLPETLALSAVGASPNNRWEVIEQQFRVNPWWMPGQKKDVLPTVTREIGAFVGLGGIFLQPPQVRFAPDGFWVRSKDRCSLLIVDCWGAVLLPGTLEEFQQAPTASFANGAKLKGNQLIFPNRSLSLDLPADHLTVICNEHTAAVTSSYTHAIRLFPLV